jgi:hypothetical protein
MNIKNAVVPSWRKVKEDAAAKIQVALENQRRVERDYEISARALALKLSLEKEEHEAD